VGEIRKITEKDSGFLFAANKEMKKNKEIISNFIFLNVNLLNKDKTSPKSFKL
jgi:hypothetical protein